MSWWTVLRDGLRHPRADGGAGTADLPVQRHAGHADEAAHVHERATGDEAAPAAAVPTPRGTPSALSEDGEAWRDLPALQRSLAEPIRPAAPLDAFTGSLAAHQNPSFLAPLGHRVEPEAGGLVDGLADLTGRPLPYVGGGDLAVPHTSSAAKPAVQRTIAQWATPFGERPAASGFGAPESVAEPVETAAVLDEPLHLDTVPMERPIAGLGGESVLTGTGTPAAPLAISVPAVASPASVQRHAGHDHDETEADEPTVAPTVSRLTEPADAPTASRLAEASEAPTASRPAEPPSAPPVVQRAVAPSAEAATAPTTDEDAPTLGRHEDSAAGIASSPSRPTAGAAERVASDATTVRAEPSAMPVVGVQRQAAQHDLGFRRVWPVVPDGPAPVPGIPPLPTLELPVSRLAEAGPSDVERDGPTAAAARATPAPQPSPTAGSGTGALDAPLSGFAAAIAAIQTGGADPDGQEDDSVGVPGGAAGVAAGEAAAAGAGPLGHLPVQRLAGPGEVVRREFEQPGAAEQAETGQAAAVFEEAGTEAPTLGGSALAATDLNSVPGGEETEFGGTGGLETGGAGEARRGYGSGPAPATTSDVPRSGLPELPVVTSTPAAVWGSADSEAAAVPGGSAALPVATAPVQRSAAASAPQPLRTVDLVASRTPTLQLKALSSATPVPPAVQRVTFLPDTAPQAPTGGRRPEVTMSRLTEPSRAALLPAASGPSHAPQAGEPAVQRSVAFPGGPAGHQAAAAAATIGSGAGDRAGAPSTAGPAEGDMPDVAAQGVDRHPAALEVAELEDHPAARQSRVETVPIQRVATAASTAAAASARPTVSSEVAGLEAYETVQRAAAQGSQHRQSTVMPPMPIVQRHVAPAEKPASGPAARSGAVSFASMFAAATEAAETGYTTVQLLADDDSVAAGVDEPAELPAADTAAPAVQRQGEGGAPASAPAGGGGTGAPGAGGGGPAGADLDEMARRLFDPLAARLRAEFWLDRERAGLMTDARP